MACHAMDSRITSVRLSIFVLCISISTTTLITLCEARRNAQSMIFQDPKLLKALSPGLMRKLQVQSHKDIDAPSDFSDAELYAIGSPFSLPPLESLAPVPMPDNTPPFCVNAPLTPQQPSSAIPSPIRYAPPPPPPPSKPNIPIPSPPSNTPSPPTYSPVPNPPENEPSPPGCSPNPPENGPSPPKHLPSPPIYLPPLVFPPPSVPPTPHKKSQLPVWCVAKPSVPDPIIQEAMDYACGSGADCKSIQPKGSCYQPDTMLAHASYAFNSYWQKTKIGGGTCDFGGTAMLVRVDPSFEDCQFIYN
ncbi:pollen-specific leucine-rich repeat extensin-like protein 3 [Juglans regia]|uniref:Pollen-specific leucine-rich repeat extensin-like protein 3 n=1 Tax=Juglans regia TaxID=51240 RepID=A0A2I4FG40_JUGRE|nr:pollen-specific leucine-rich repeat extensin-like protein 3 [Juglans regia]